MYSFLEIEAICKACINWDELERACQAFLWVISDRDLTYAQQLFLSEQTTKRFREIENI